MLSAQPVFILQEALQYMAQGRIVAPGYTYLQDMVGRTVSGERLRITRLLDRALTTEVERQLKALLEADESMYRISILKHEPKDFSYGELRQEVERGKFFQPLFEFGHAFLTSAGLSNESVKYYASLVQFYTVYKLQRMAVPTARLYLLCFATHRFRQINDNLIDAFIHLVDDYEQQAKIAAEIAAAEAMAEATGNLQAAGQVLNLFLDPAIEDSTPFSQVRQRAFSLLDAERFGQVSEYMQKIEFDKAAFEWSFYGKLHAKFKLNLRHLFANLDFSGLVEDAPLLEAVAFLQEIPTVNARHGSKYFGLRKGVSAYTMVANQVPCNARIIGTHEHELHFVFDILHNNTTDIKPERHSTDTHGTNQVNFLLLLCDGYQFAPRYRDPTRKRPAWSAFAIPATMPTS